MSAERHLYEIAQSTHVEFGNPEDHLCPTEDVIIPDDTSLATAIKI